MAVRRHDPPSVPPPPGPFSHVVEAGGIVLLSGQTGRTSEGSLSESTTAQTIAAFDSVGAVLADIGLSPADALGFRIFLVGREHLADFQAGRRTIFDRWYGPGPYPTSTVAFVSGLVDERAIVEIETIAVRTGRAPSDQRD